MYVAPTCCAKYPPRDCAWWRLSEALASGVVCSPRCGWGSLVVHGCGWEPWPRAAPMLAVASPVGSAAAAFLGQLALQGFQHLRALLLLELNILKQEVVQFVEDWVDAVWELCFLPRGSQ